MSDREPSALIRTQVCLTPKERRARLVLSVLPIERRARPVRRFRHRAATWALTSFAIAMLAVAVTAINDILLPSFSSGAPPTLWVPPVEAGEKTAVEPRHAAQPGNRYGGGDDRLAAGSSAAPASAHFGTGRTVSRITDDRSGNAGTTSGGNDRSGSSGDKGTPQTDETGAGDPDAADASPATSDDPGSQGGSAAPGTGENAGADDSGASESSGSSSSGQEPGDDSSSSGSGSSGSGSSGSGSSGSGSSGSGDDSGSSGSSGSGSGGDDSGGGHDDKP